jgi:hypothetical protein
VIVEVGTVGEDIFFGQVGELFKEFDLVKKRALKTVTRRLRLVMSLERNQEGGEETVLI